MAGLNHSFFLVRASEFAPAEFDHFVTLPGEIELHDDLLRYMGDTLAWIPTHNPARDEPCMGLCMYGPTLIHVEGARVAAAVFSTWARLFALGPSDLDLTGGYAWVGADPSTGDYERLHIGRDVLCSRLNGLALRAEQVASGEGRLYLLHFGV
ncbi:hypothetical protein [Polyangium sp. 6x1]|uniref:hypothetical protein n=1 Tax=Polyangium sp. 6x1 TaxID=3042689 RepID=UPI002482FA08|nr:hypothetical protein [Polyangium sp. 6x1]MDI1446051.1 hypothetical protein [Polyangium sp. 6x1]